MPDTTGKDIDGADVTSDSNSAIGADVKCKSADKSDLHKNNTGNSSDSDVIIEEDVEVILTDKTIEKVAAKEIADISDQVQKVSISGTDKTDEKDLVKETSDNSDQVQKVSISDEKDGSQGNEKSQQKRKGNNSSKDLKGKGKNTPKETPKKKYVSVDDMSGSPVVKNLFQGGGMEESRAANRIIQRTAKVGVA